MTVSVCINTHKRPQLLENLLTSLRNQMLVKEMDLEIIVVDNSLEKEGEKVVEEFNKKNKSQVKYDFQPIKNISLTRNKAVSLATGTYVCFIDDDGVADKNWVFEMHACLQKYDADGVFGAVIPFYEESVPEWIVKGNFFRRPEEKTGSEPNSHRTTNCMIKSEVLRQIDGPFDPGFGLTGGEDSNLFKKLVARGAKFVFCNEGIVHDFIPQERSNLNWLMKRHYRSGITNTQVRMQISKNKFFRGLYFILRYTVLLLISVFLFIVNIPFKSKRIYWLLKIAGIMGHFAYFINLEFKEYN